MTIKLKKKKNPLKNFSKEIFEIIGKIVRVEYSDNLGRCSIIGELSRDKKGILFIDNNSSNKKNISAQIKFRNIDILDIVISNEILIKIHLTNQVIDNIVYDFLSTINRFDKLKTLVNKIIQVQIGIWPYKFLIRGKLKYNNEFERYYITDSETISNIFFYEDAIIAYSKDEPTYIILNLKG